MRRLWIGIARRLEPLLERIGRRPGPPVLEAYIGYAAGDRWVLRGRVLTRLRGDGATDMASRWRTVRQMAGLFLTDEVAGVAVRAAGICAWSDAEGYVRLELPAPAAASGPWGEVEMIIDRGAGPVAVAGARAVCPVRVPGPEAAVMIVSDIDDTVIETGSWSLLRNLWTTFTRALPERKVHADARALLQALSDTGRNPVFYVSSSPWNMHGYLKALFARSGVPSGPIFLRDLGVTPDGRIGARHGDHKTAAIEEILAAQPGLPVILLGDTGQKDAEIYAGIVARHPGRVRAVALRKPVARRRPSVVEALARIEAAGVPCHHGRSFEGAQRWIDPAPPERQE
jgi:phosphatidate phosphatase APP1